MESDNKMYFISQKDLDNNYVMCNQRTINISSLHSTILDVYSLVSKTNSNTSNDILEVWNVFDKYTTFHSDIARDILYDDLHMFLPEYIEKDIINLVSRFTTPIHSIFTLLLINDNQDSNYIMPIKNITLVDSIEVHLVSDKRTSIQVSVTDYTVSHNAIC